MNTIEAIYARRSIRKYKDQKVEKGMIERILKATIKAPSGKNKQPWKFVVLQGAAKDELVAIMQQTIERLKKAKINTGSSEYTVRFMQQAPVLVLVFNTGETASSSDDGPAKHYMNLVDVQSIGGAIQTMLLAAEELGLGTLWICDVFYADSQICEYLKTRDQLIAAVSIGHKDEYPDARPRKKLEEVVEWRS